MLDSMIVISSYEQIFDGRLARMTEHTLPFLSSAPMTMVLGNAKDQKPKIQSRSNEKNDRDSSPQL